LGNGDKGLDVVPIIGDDIDSGVGVVPTLGLGKGLDDSSESFGLVISVAVAEDSVGSGAGVVPMRSGRQAAAG